MPFTGTDGDSPQKREMDETGNDTKLHPSDNIRPQPSSGITIFPRMLKFNVNESTDTTRRCKQLSQIV